MIARVGSVAPRVRAQPELVALAVAVIAWVALLAVHAAPTMIGGLAGGGSASALAGSAVAIAGRAAVVGLPEWALMSAAMMVPVAIPAARHVGRNSLRRRRHRAVATFLSAYLALWVLFGGVALFAAWWWHGSSWGAAMPAEITIAAAITAAAVWQLTPVRRRQLRGCRRSIPLPPHGVRADLACARFGARYGLSCIGSCWALMLVMATVAGAHLPWTVGLTAVMLAERRTPLLSHRPQIVTGVLVGLAILIVVLGGGDAAADELSWFCRLPAAAGATPGAQ